MKKIIIMVILLFSSTAHAGIFDGTWDEKNTALHVPLTLTLLVDLGQTLYNVDKYYQYDGWGKNGEYHAETNSVLGKRPNKEKVYAYFMGAWGLITATTWKLDPGWSHAFQGSVITFELNVIDGNIALGAKVEF
jgi:hypothetical protein